MLLRAYSLNNNSTPLNGGAKNAGHENAGHFDFDTFVFFGL